ncbi:MAG: type IV secretion system protein [Rickettsiaceae bacterium]|nr:type IV secretion system protein [Rickettsiaceae bacterium]
MKVKLALILISLYIALISVGANANSFGDSCVSLPGMDDSEYLNNDTAYGFIRENIDITTHSEGKCDQQGDIFKFCIRNASGDPTPCTQVSLSLNNTAQLSSLTNNPDIIGSSFLQNVSLSVANIENRICLVMPTSRGQMPLLCRNAENIGGDESEETGNDPLPTCRVLGDGCYDGESKSQSIFSFSGLVIHCLRDSLDKMFYTINECQDPEGEITLTMLRPFPQFQMIMTTAVRAALILYVMFYGLKLAMNYEVATPNQIFLFLLKFILVLYFAVGIWGGEAVDGMEVKRNGMTDFALPFLVDMTSQFASLVFLAAGSSNLCVFDHTKYETGYSFYQLWDAIDCRIGFYLGLDLIHNMGAADLDTSGNLFESSNTSQMPAIPGIGNFMIFTVLFGFLMGGGIVVLIILIIFVIIFVSVVMYFITAYLVCMVTLYVMSYLAPIFVPMMLFHRTKEYFESWLKIVVSCALQPAIIGGFLAMLLTVFDTAMYGNCEFNRIDYTISGNSFSTFQLALPENEIEKCEESVGYKLLKLYSGDGWERLSLILFEVPRISDYVDILASMVYLSLYMALFYYFIKSANTFSSRLVGGPDLSSVTVNPNMLVDKVISLAKAAAGYAIAAGRFAAGNVTGAIGDAIEATAEAAKDTSDNSANRSDNPDGGNLVGSNEHGGDKEEGKSGNQKDSKLAKTKVSDVIKSAKD